MPCFQRSTCCYQFGVLSGRIFESCKLTSPKWLVKHKLMEVMVLRKQGHQLIGRIWVDYTHLGG